MSDSIIIVIATIVLMALIFFLSSRKHWAWGMVIPTLLVIGCIISIIVLDTQSPFQIIKVFSGVSIFSLVTLILVREKIKQKNN